MGVCGNRCPVSATRQVRLGVQVLDDPAGTLDSSLGGLRSNAQLQLGAELAGQGESADDAAERVNFGIKRFVNMFHQHVRTWESWVCEQMGFWKPLLDPASC
jgi:hypothetical protein